MERLNAAGERLRAIRIAEGLTMERLCALIWSSSSGAWNPDRRDIYRLERGTRKLTDLELVVLARAIKVPPAELIDPTIEISVRAEGQPRIVPRRASKSTDKE